MVLNLITTAFPNRRVSFLIYNVLDENNLLIVDTVKVIFLAFLCQLMV